MFSLIITIISIALVAALALATLYYGGDAFNQGRADAKASQILSQSQQLMVATDLYYANHGAWPLSTQDLIDGEYLKSVPMAQAQAIKAALAEDQAWVMPLPGVPVFVLPATEAGPCQRVNLRSFRMDGILAEVNESIAAQCYGPSTNTADLKTVVSKSGTYLSALATAVSAGNPDLVATVPLTPGDFGSEQTAVPDPDAEDGTWTTPPGTVVADSGGGSTPPSGATARANFTLTQASAGSVTYSFTPFGGADLTAMAPGRLELQAYTDGVADETACEWYIFDSNATDGDGHLSANADCDWQLGKPNSLLQNHTGTYFTVTLNGIGGWNGSLYGQPTFTPSGAELAHQTVTGQSQYQWCVTFDTEASPWNITASQPGVCN